MARILVVDDSIENLTLIELFLRGTEFDPVTASGGREALELCSRESFELILLDVVMPTIDGFEVCRRLKDDPRTAFVPVIFLTGRLVDESDKVAAYKLGAVDYIQKPVNREELVARIRVMRRLEQTRSQLDRENAALREEVEALGRSLHAVSREIEQLQRLRHEFDSTAEPGVLALDADGKVVAVDPSVRDLLGDIQVGVPLTECGHAASRVARLLADGARSADLTLPRGGDAARVARVAVRTNVSGGTFLLIRDVTGLAEAERLVRERELAESEGDGATGDGESGDGPSIEHGYAMTDYVGRSSEVLALNETVDRLRQSRSTVLIHGESGTGKELVARALHFDGANRNEPFIPMHCGAIAPELVESELFGHERGAFTGAEQSRDGLFRAADGGTIFLDEIAEMSVPVQIKLLRVLQRGEIRRVGANQPRIVDVRIIAATNQDLAALVKEGKFREDLYYRLQVVSLELPALRDRTVDLPLLIDNFIKAANVRHGRKDLPVQGVSRGAMERLVRYDWPGNVRELENVIERAFALGVGDVLQLEDLPQHIIDGRSSLAAAPDPVIEDGATASDLPDLKNMRRAAERQAILQALSRSGGDKIAAAAALGMSRSTFYRRLKELGL
ncbi:MAG: sigma-54 dependent transcriptional regulator [bacterium]|nr:sigma-54 dependent transcriptional regulator [bacterium]